MGSGCRPGQRPLFRPVCAHSAQFLYIIAWLLPLAALRLTVVVCFGVRRRRPPAIGLSNPTTTTTTTPPLPPLPPPSSSSPSTHKHTDCPQNTPQTLPLPLSALYEIHTLLPPCPAPTAAMSQDPNLFSAFKRPREVPLLPSNINPLPSNYILTLMPNRRWPASPTIRILESPSPRQL